MVRVGLAMLLQDIPLSSLVGESTMGCSCDLMQIESEG